MTEVERLNTHTHSMFMDVGANLFFILFFGDPTMKTEEVGRVVETAYT